MQNQYLLTLAAIESRLYTNEADSIFMRWPTAEKGLPAGNHTSDGLSATCLHFIDDIMTRTGRPNHKWDNFLFLHFGGWDLLMDYVGRDPKRRGYLLRCEEKGYSVSGDRRYFDEALVSNGIVNGIAAAVPSSAMNCIIEANIYLVRNYCGMYSGATMDTLCAEIRRFLETGSDEEKDLSPQMDPQDRYCLFMYIRSCLDKYESDRNDGADKDVLARHLGTALAWLLLSALLRDSCENMCRLIPSPSIQLLRVKIREALESPAPAVAPSSLPPVPALFLGREEELSQIGHHLDSNKAPFFITGEGACGKTSLAASFASRADRFISIYAVYRGDLMSTVASVRFRDTLPMDRADVQALYTFNLSRITQYSDRLLIIIDNFDAPLYDRTFTELLSQPVMSGASGQNIETAGTLTDAPSGLTNADVLEDLMRTGARLLFTTRASVPPQYASLCLSDAEHELPLQVLLALAKKIYTSCSWTEYEEVLMSQIILAAGKHVMLVELLSAALQQQSGFGSLEEVLAKLKSLQLTQIEGDVTTRRSPAARCSVYDMMRQVFRFSAFEGPVRQMLRQLSLLSPLGMDKEPFLQLLRCDAATVKNTLLRLRDLHLVSIDPRTAHISMHPVLSDVCAADLGPDDQNCGTMIMNAVRFYDEDSTVRYDARHLEQVAAMCMRCALIPGVTRAVSVDLSLAVSAIEYRLGSYGSALEWAEHALELMNAVDSSHPTQPQNAEGEFPSPEMSDSMDKSAVKHRAEALKWAARASSLLGMYDKAIALYQEEICLLTQEMGEEHPDTAVALNDYGVALEEKGCYEEALDCLLKTWGIQEKLFGDDSLEICATCNNLGLVCSDMGDWEKAETFYRHSLTISHKYYGDSHPETAICYSNLGELLMHCQDDQPTREQLDESRRCLTKALQINTDAFGPAYPGNACILSNLGILEDLESNYVKAREHYRKALEIQGASAGKDHPHCADILHNLGVSYIDEALESFSSPEAFAASPIEEKQDSLPLLREALECERRALSIARAALGESHFSVEMLMNEIAWLESVLK